MSVRHEIVDVTPDNLDEYDLFCKKSKRKEEGYQQKVEWFRERFNEGLRMKVLYVEDNKKMTSRGFIEYIPAEYAWRVVIAPNHNVIHCLWVVGKWKKHGFGARLIDACVKDSKKTGKVGVAMVTSDGHWLVSKKVFLKNGFEEVDSAPPTFQLLVKKFKDAQNPTFPTNWEARAKKFGKGLTIVYTPQCPYQPEATSGTLEIAKEIGIDARAIELKSAQEVQKKSPSAFGIWGMVLDGKLFSYNFLSRKELVKRLQEQK
jgi:hypothetical protein